MLGIALKYPLIFNAHRSSIVLHEMTATKCLPLYISERACYKTLDQAINLLLLNLRNILSTLERLKEREGIGRIDLAADSNEKPEPSFQNYILVALYRICEFQVY